MTLHQTDRDSMLIFLKLSYGRTVFTHRCVCVCVHGHTYWHISSLPLIYCSLISLYLWGSPILESSINTILRLDKVSGSLCARIPLKMVKTTRKKFTKRKQQKFRHAAPEQGVGRRLRVRVSSAGLYADELAPVWSLRPCLHRRRATNDWSRPTN